MISYRFHNLLDRISATSYCPTFSHNNYRNQKFDFICQLQLVIDVSNYNNIEAPLITFAYIKDILTTNKKGQHSPVINKIVINSVFYGSDTYKTSFPAIYNSMDMSVLSITFKKVMVDDKMFYMNPGLILDSDYNILAGVFFKGEVTPDSIFVSKKIFKISPRVFNNTDKISKYIKGKFMTNLITRIYTSNTPWVNSVSVENLDKYTAVTRNKPDIVDIEIPVLLRDRVAKDLSNQILF